MKRMRGGILPLAAVIPALMAAGKAATLEAVSGAAGYGVKRGLRAVTQKKKKRQPPRLNDVDSETPSSAATPKV